MEPINDWDITNKKFKKNADFITFLFRVFGVLFGSFLQHMMLGDVGERPTAQST